MTSETTVTGDNVGEVHLRPLRLGDAPGVLAAFGSDRDMARQGDVRSLHDAELYVSALLDDAARWPWAVVEENRIIGLVCVDVDAVNRSGWFWYWMHAYCRGRGWMGRAAATVAEWALTEGGLERLELEHRVNNAASGAVARAAGFVKEGALRSKLVMDGERVDVDAYGRLDTDPGPAYQPFEMRHQPQSVMR
ncbi:GNAT family N-acetyltransferase [Parenemella sanctibonifatiensis]|uniref:GNAT family N-acetyltransferase n=1 Tax=Parenemella sanctibonifatiensis TaxID=2016505 RepID=A0A255E8N9_9ACTN|nr:GNAT family protein [Parenemella sanctibonifatiensis]OYN87650.1 GNAT family N-acetyltransferase [Parenemella sanctibonifatiensis]